MNNKDKGFSLARTGSFPAGLQTVSFADIGQSSPFLTHPSLSNTHTDRDGTIDMVFTTCTSVNPSTGVGANCAINIAYNKQLQLCETGESSKGGKRCRSPEELCVGDDAFQFDLTGENDAFVSIPVSSLFPGESGSPSLLVMDTTHNPPIPLPIKLGDANVDGFTDMLFVLSTQSAMAPNREKRTPKLVMSVPCEGGVAGCTNGRGRRGFSVVRKGAKGLEMVSDARGVAFVDMDEDVSEIRLLPGLFYLECSCCWVTRVHWI